MRRPGAYVGIFPTGFGKSLCFQYPVSAWRWRVLVVEPLVAIMDEQVERAKAMGIRALAIHSSQSPEERLESERRLRESSWDLLFVSAERLGVWEQKGMLEKILGGIDLFVVDEAHCIIPWAKFRPAYRNLAGIVRAVRRQGKSVLALTATLSPEWLRELSEQWGERFSVLRMPLGRENIRVVVRACESLEARWVYLHQELSQRELSRSSIIYCRSREQTEDLALHLFACGMGAAAYHAGQPAEQKRATARDFRAGRIPILVATSAFGMGMDPPSVGLVLHWSPPESLEDYWQEVGRGGRDGGSTKAVLLVGYWDLARHVVAYPGKEGESPLWNYIAAHECRKRRIAIALGCEQSENCGICDRCFSKQNLFCEKKDTEELWWIRHFRLRQERKNSERFASSVKRQSGVS